MPTPVCSQMAAAQPSSSGKSYTVVARQGEPTKPTAKIVDETVARDLLRDKDSVGGLDSLQLFVAGQGGNGTRFRCEYSLDVAVKHVRTTVVKLVYLGADGISATGDQFFQPLDPLLRVYHLRHLSIMI